MLGIIYGRLWLDSSIMNDYSTFAGSNRTCKQPYELYGQHVKPLFPSISAYRCILGFCLFSTAPSCSRSTSSTLYCTPEPYNSSPCHMSVIFSITITILISIPILHLHQETNTTIYKSMLSYLSLALHILNSCRIFPYLIRAILLNPTACVLTNSPSITLLPVQLKFHRCFL